MSPRNSSLSSPRRALSEDTQQDYGRCGGQSHACLPASSCRYLAGGVESGFRKVDRDKYEARLLQVKGRRNIRVQQVRTHSQCIWVWVQQVGTHSQCIWVWVQQVGMHSQRIWVWVQQVETHS